MRRARTNLPRQIYLAAEDARGATAIEFAIILPAIVLMAIAVVDLGQGIHRNMQVQNAAQMGAQYAAMHGNDTTEITNVVTGSTDFAITASPAPRVFCGCASGTSVSEIDCTLKCSGGITPGSYVTVSAQGSYTTIIAYPLLPASFTFQSRSTVRIQ